MYDIVPSLLSGTIDILSACMFMWVYQLVYTCTHTRYKCIFLVSCSCTQSFVVAVWIVKQAGNSTLDCLFFLSVKPFTKLGAGTKQWCPTPWKSVLFVFGEWHVYSLAPTGPPSGFSLLVAQGTSIVLIAIPKHHAYLDHQYQLENFRYWMLQSSSGWK